MLKRKKKTVGFSDRSRPSDKGEDSHPDPGIGGAGGGGGMQKKKIGFGPSGLSVVLK